MNDRMLKPRQRPNSPPRDETNWTGPTRMLLSSSEWCRQLTLVNSTSYEACLMLILMLLLTHDSLLSKKDVDHCQVFSPRIIRITLVLKKNKITNILFFQTNNEINIVDRFDILILCLMFKQICKEKGKLRNTLDRSLMIESKCSALLGLEKSSM